MRYFEQQNPRVDVVTAAPACRRARILPLLVCIALFSVVDFLVGLFPRISGPRDAAEPLLYACVGSIGAQMGLHAIWFVLAPVVWRIRLVVATVAGLFCFAAWAIGHAVGVALRPYERDDVDVLMTIIIVVFLCLPLPALGTQLPLWLARIWRRWRIVHSKGTAAILSLERFGIRHMFIGMTAVALALGAVRLADMIMLQDGLLIPMVITALVATITSLLAILPLIVATLRSQRLWLSLSVTFLLDVFVVVGYVVIGTLRIGSSPPPQLFMWLAFMVGGFFVSGTAVMLVVRCLGYRLEWGRPS